MLLEGVESNTQHKYAQKTPNPHTKTQRQTPLLSSNHSQIPISKALTAFMARLGTAKMRNPPLSSSKRRISPSLLVG